MRNRKTPMWTWTRLWRGARIVRLTRQPVIAMLLFLPATAFAGSASLEFASPIDYGGFVAQRVIPLANGNKLVVGSQISMASFTSPVNGSLDFDNRLEAVGVFLDASGNSTAVYFNLGTGNDVIADAAVDQAGNIWLAGNTDSDDFPLVHPVFTAKKSYQMTGFVVEFDPTGRTILFSTFMGSPASGSVSAIALDPAGNAYVTGSAITPGFPYIGTGGIYTESGNYAFVVKILGASLTIGYSLEIGGGGPDCVPGLYCGATQPTSISVDAAGDATIAGLTNGGVPTTPNALQTTCTCGQGGALISAGFITRFAPDGKSLIFSTYLNGTDKAFGSVQAIAVDSSGNVYAYGVASTGFPVTPNALQPMDLETAPIPGSPFLAELSSDGSTLLYGTYFGQSSGQTISGIHVDSQDNLWITGASASSAIPTLPNTSALGNDFALELNTTTGALQGYSLPTGVVTQPPVFDRNGNLLLLSANSSLLTLNPAGPIPSPSLLALENAGAQIADGGVNPGELVTLSGVNLVPSAPVKTVPDANGFYPTTVSGVQVLFSGTPAPLIFVGGNQIELQVPAGLAAGATISVVTPAATIGPIPVPLKTSLGLFQSSPGVAIALNQDLTLNSPANPSKAGDVVALYITGVAASTIGANSQAASPLDVASLGIEVTNHNQPGPVPITYLGPAPGIIDGVSQLNVQVLSGDVAIPESLNYSGVVGALLTLSYVGPSGTAASSNSVLVYLK